MSFLHKFFGKKKAKGHSQSTRIVVAGGPEGCDICANPGVLPIVSSDQMRKAVFENGFNPFALGLISNSVASLYNEMSSDKDAYERWKDLLVAQDVLGWGICSSCMAKLQPYLTEGNIGKDVWDVKPCTLVCPHCSQNFNVGEDSIIVTDEDVRGSFIELGDKIIIGEGTLDALKGTPKRRPDLVMYSGHLSIDKRKRELEKIQNIKADLQHGQVRSWKCDNCRHYTTPNAYHFTKT